MFKIGKLFLEGEKKKGSASSCASMDRAKKCRGIVKRAPFSKWARSRNSTSPALEKQANMASDRELQFRRGAI